MSKGCDIIVSERGDAMCGRSRLSRLMAIWGMLEGLPRMLVSRDVILVSLLLADTMGMRGAVLQFVGTLVVLVMRSAVISSGHI
jgi:hypothetical protein